MAQAFVQAYEISNVNKQSIAGEIEFTVDVNLTMGDTASISGWVVFGSNKSSMYIEDVGMCSVEAVAICTTWLALHKERIAEDVRNIYKASLEA